jgi:Integral membrane protein, interacts with FtsH
VNQIFSKVFMWLFVGLALTFGIAYTVSGNETMIYNLFSGGKYLLIWAIEFIVVIVLCTRINKMSFMTAVILFLLYSGLTGLTLSSIFILYEISSIVWVFGIAAGLFLIFGLIGYFTKIDLTKFGTFLLMGLLALIVAMIINMFVGNESFDIMLCIVGIVIFLGYIAYDIQLIKNQMQVIEDEDKLAIYGAFQLYLDFINLFLRLLRLFGNRKN